MKNRKAEHSRKAPADKRPAYRKEQRHVIALLESARQNVKPIVKKERQNEIVTPELMAFRLK
jgi:hypothetical protein